MRTSALALVAFLAFLAVLAAATGPAAAPGKAPQPPRTLLAFDWQENSLAYVDPVTLRRTGKQVRSANPISYAFSPDGGRIVLARDFAYLELVDLRAMRNLGRFQELGRTSWVDTVIWGEPDRVVALVRSQSTRAVTLDPVKRRVVAEVPISGAVTATARGRNAIAVLVGPDEGFGASRLHVVDSRGRVRTARLLRVRSGWTFNRDTGNGRRIQPGVALDPAGTRAVVIQPTGPAAEVDLATMNVRYHELEQARSLSARLHDWLEPNAHAKSVLGPELWAHWIGRGAVAVASWEHTGIGTRDGENRALARTHGVFLVDTRTWTRRTLSETASGVEPGGDVALVYAGPFAAGRPFGADEGRPPRGLEVYGTDGRRRFRFFGARVVGGAQTAGAYAYVRAGNKAFDVVDLRSGRMLGRATPKNELSLLTVR